MGADDLETVADSLVGDIVVAGPRAGIEAVGKRTDPDGTPRVVATEDTEEFGDTVGDVGVAVVALDGSAAPTVARAAADAEGFVVAVFDGHGDERVDPALLERVREAVDVTLLACGRQATDGSERAAGTSRSRSAVAVRGAFDFVRMLRTPGHINLDLADARTVLTDGSLAVLAGGSADFATDGPRRAVRRAFSEMSPWTDAHRGSGALVSVVGGPELSIDDATAAVRAVRGAVGEVDDLIWGVAMDDALAGRVAVDVVVDDVTYRPPLSGGDPCRRCGATLSTYTLGDRMTVACEHCGFADVSVPLADRPAGNPRR